MDYNSAAQNLPRVARRCCQSGSAAPVTAIRSAEPGACLPRVLPAERQDSMITESFNRTLKVIALAAMLIATMFLATGCGFEIGIGL
jgi:hypothetical protein